MFNTLCKWSWSKTFSSLLPQSSVLPVPNTMRLELQMWSWPLSQWVHMTWQLSPVVHTFQGSPLSGPDILEFPRWTLKLDFYSGNPAQIPCFQDTVFVSKHVVPPFSQSLKSTIDYLKSVLAACPNSRWSEMWVLPLSQLHPVYNPKDYQSVILWNIHWTYLFYNKNGQETYQKSKCKTQNWKTLRRKHKERASWHWVWRWFLRYDTKGTKKLTTILTWEDRPTQWEKVN